ncbi:hypothetical protein NE619_12985 [Anaerovorax odorimutans]|uniref:Lipoprotein n=1 Tax=Anaerovorax odorimutans TaxID=109327 RepID=A0ABT1RR20_9FIRM|nr:hypothetical protein [Anaerovorax odorimutans]MCQ4637642.1 hypothetical protein [Anaerovorax odorimutans]
MKKKLFVIITVAVMLLLPACGSSKSSSSGGSTDSAANEGPGMMEIMLKDMTAGEEDLMEIAGLDQEVTTGLLQYKVDDTVKSAHVKIMEYSGDTGKWKEISDSFQMKTGKTGEIMVIYSNGGKTVRVALTDGENSMAANIDPGLRKFSGDKDISSAQLKGKKPIKLHEEIALHMVAESEPGKEPDLIIGVGDYPDGKALKDYTSVRAVVIEFSDEKA